MAPSNVVILSLEQLRAVKRLEQTTGYLELGLAQPALDNLAAIPAGSDFEGPKQFLRGHALRMMGRETEAAEAFAFSADFQPSPVVQQALALMSAAEQQAADRGVGQHLSDRRRGWK